MRLGRIVLPIHIHLRRRITVSHACPNFQLRVRLAHGMIPHDVLLNIDSASIPLFIKFSGFRRIDNGEYVMGSAGEPGWMPLLETEEIILEVK